MQAAHLNVGKKEMHSPTPHYMDECQNKGDRKWAICKWLKRKSGIVFGGSARS
jgi:hypothetical protein